MKVLLVLAHPEPNSFNGAMARVAEQALSAAGHLVAVSDLYRMGFDPRSTRANFTSVKDAGYFKPQIEEMHATEVGGFSPELEAEMRKLEGCDLMIWQFPLWWFGLPAALKGWVDRVFAKGRFYGNGRIYETGRMKGKRAMLSLTTGGLAASYAKDGYNGNIEQILRPIHRGMLQFVGFDVLRPQIVYGPVRLTDEERANELDAWRERLAGIAAEPPMDVGRY